MRGGAKAGATPLDATSRPNSKLLPGATASTFTGAGTIESLMRCLFKSRCRLSSFARSFATQRFEGPDDDLTTSASLFPTPIPYPEVFLKKGERTVGADSRKKFVVLAVIVLNFLHHNRPRSVEKLLKRGQRLRRKQWEIVRIIERQAAAWFEVSPIGAEEMGRAAQKVEGLEGILSKLERSASLLSHQMSNYLPSKSEEKRGVEKIPGLKADGGNLSTFKPIESSRLKFVGRPTFNPSPFLDPLSRRIYENPLKERDPITSQTPKPPHLRVHCLQGED